MTTVTVLIFILIFIVYGGINYYVGLRGWQHLFVNLPFLSSKAYWLVLWFAAWSYPAARLGRKIFPPALESFIFWVGSYWLAILFYLFLPVLLMDITRLLSGWLAFLPRWNTQAAAQFMMAGAIIFAAVVVIYGTWNSRTPRIAHYDIDIPKPAGAVQKLNTVMVSDIHLGRVVDIKRLRKLVTMVEGLEPDIIFLAGDIFDRRVAINKGDPLYEEFTRLEAPMGKYAVLGNHEYINGYVEETIQDLGKTGIHILRDSHLLVRDSFYVVGRDDVSRNYHTDTKRQELSSVMTGVDRNLPVILLDHQPVDLPQARAQGVDLQLSGHTHVGQISPLNLITRRVFEVDWGYLDKDGLQIIVSSGYGTWGPPIRVGNRPEIIHLTINFKG